MRWVRLFNLTLVVTAALNKSNGSRFFAYDDSFDIYETIFKTISAAAMLYS